jgi:hypothetical protein
MMFLTSSGFLKSIPVIPRRRSGRNSDKSCSISYLSYPADIFSRYLC